MEVFYKKNHGARKDKKVRVYQYSKDSIGKPSNHLTIKSVAV